MTNKNLKRLKIIVYALIVNFVLLFSSGFIPVERFFLIFLIAILILGIILTIKTYKLKIPGNLKIYLLLTGFSSIVFSISLFIGVLAVMGYYSYPEIIFFITVLGSLAVFIIGAIRSLILLKKGGKRKNEL